MHGVALAMGNSWSGAQWGETTSDLPTGCGPHRGHRACAEPTQPEPQPARQRGCASAAAGTPAQPGLQPRWAPKPSEAPGPGCPCAAVLDRAGGLWRAGPADLRVEDLVAADLVSCCTLPGRQPSGAGLLPAAGLRSWPSEPLPAHRRRGVSSQCEVLWGCSMLKLRRGHDVLPCSPYMSATAFRANIWRTRVQCADSGSRHNTTGQEAGLLATELGLNLQSLARTWSEDVGERQRPAAARVE